MARREMPPGGADAIRIVSRATPPVQASSKRKLAVMAVGVLAGGVALLLGLIRGYVITLRDAPEPAPRSPAPQTPSPTHNSRSEPQPDPDASEPTRSRSRTRLPVLARVSETR